MDRPALLAGLPAREDIDISAYPGKSERARWTAWLAREAGYNGDILRNVFAPSRPMKPSNATAHGMMHNALMQWIPSAYAGHDGYVASHEQTGSELLHALVLDGDRRANHHYFYREPSGGEWTLASGEAAASWYSLPRDKNACIHPQGLRESLVQALNRDSFLLALRNQPGHTLSQCADGDKERSVRPWVSLNQARMRADVDDNRQGLQWMHDHLQTQRWSNESDRKMALTRLRHIAKLLP